MTRPNIAFHINHLSQFLQYPSNIHTKTTKRVLKYVKGTLTLVLRFTPSNHSLNSVVSYCESNWESNINDRISIFGFSIWYGGNVVR